MKFKVPVYSGGRQIKPDLPPTSQAILPPVYSDREYEDDFHLKKEESKPVEIKVIPVKEKTYPRFKKKRPRIPRHSPSYGSIGVGAEDEKGFVSISFSQ